MAQQEAQVLPAGTQIGVFEIKEVISSGRSGILYRAWNEHLNSMVALKEYLPVDYAVRDKDGFTVKVKNVKDTSIYLYGKDKFLEFAEILTDIQQPNVVGVHNVLEFNETAYLAMDFVEGVPLSKLQADSPTFSESELKSIFIALLKALQAVHDKNTVHGDVHPSNIIIRHNGDPVLVNFAAAQLALAAYTKGLLQELRPGYAPAELYHPDKHPGPSSDLYSLGATLYFCITHADPGSILDRVEAMNSNQPDPYLTTLEEKGADFSESIRKAIYWMLHPNVDDRPQAAHDVLNMLESGGDAGSLAAVKTGKNKDAQVDIAQSNEDSSNTGLIIGAVAIVALIAAGWLFFHHEKQPEADMQTVKQETIETTTEEQNNLAEVQSGQANEKTSIPTDSGMTQEVIAEVENEATAGAVSQEELAQEEVAGGDETQDLVVLDEAVSETTSQDEIASENADSSSVPVATDTEKQADQQEQASVEAPESGKSPDTGSVKADVVAAEASTVEETASVEQEVVATETPAQTTEKPLNTWQQQKITDYISAAEQDLEAFNLTTPLDDNAYIKYLAVLDMDPGNEEATAGLEKIVEIYTWLIENAIKKGEKNSARVYLKRAEAVQADNPDWQKLRNELDTLE